jgi:hypothetical protein
MNAARFTDRLELLATQQNKLYALSEVHQTALLERLTTLDSIQQQSEHVSRSISSLKSQNTLLQAVIIGGILVLVALHFIK